MNFNFPLLGTIRILLFPVSFIYFAVVWCRNRLYDLNVFKSASFNLPVICIGNLSTGGTGKSPMVEYLVRVLMDEVRVATLSRGYKRKTKGYAMADDSSSALDIGDEPMLFHLKFPGIAVTVGEERVEAIPQLLHDRPDTAVIILDDGYQHRAVKPGYHILLSDCNNLFTRDWYLPTGNLRDEKKSYKRADIIVITKCPIGMTGKQTARIENEISPLPHQHVFYSTIRYGLPYHIFTRDLFELSNNLQVLLVTGIANPGPLKKYLLEHTAAFCQLNFNDHQVFTIDDLKHIIEKFDDIPSKNKIILTTEKDAVRLTKFSNALSGLPLYVMPIEHEFLFQGGHQFNELLKAFIHNFNYTF